MDAVVTITGVGHGGSGVCRVDDWVCFVPHALPGDRLRIAVERQAKGVLWGVIEEILEPSPHRHLERGCCPITDTCVACGWLHFAYPAQGEWKQRIVGDCFERIARLNVDVAWADEPSLRQGYRTRAEFHGDGERWGFFLRGTHLVEPVRHCPLCHPRLNEALAQLWKVGLKESVEMTVNPEGDDILVWTRKPQRALKGVFASAESLRDDRRSSFLFDGAPIVNGCFSQSSLLLNRLLVRTVHEMMGAAERVLDLYCGNGNFTLGLPGGTRVLGLDHNRAAVSAASALGRGEYRAGEESVFLRAAREGPWDVIVLDPPRTGAKALVHELDEANAPALVYVSCDPATLARDVKTLSGQGWTPVRVVAVDMFPHTPHVETVCRLER